MKIIRYTLLLLLGMLIAEDADAQITIYRDSARFDDHFARLRDIDFEDLYSTTVDRIGIRNPWGLNSMGVEDSGAADLTNTFLWLGQGATLDMPTRTRRVALNGYANLFRLVVTDFNDSLFTLRVDSFPVDISHPGGIRRVQFLGEDQYGDDINWNAGLLDVTLYDEDGDTLAHTDFEELQADHYYLLGMERSAFDLFPDSTLFWPIETHGITITEPTLGFGGTFLFEGEARVDPDNPIGNLTVELAPGGAVDFPEGVEGALLTIERAHISDTIVLEVTDYAGAVDTVIETGWGRPTDTNFVEDQRWTYIHIGFGSAAGIRRVTLLDAVHEGRIMLGAVHLAEMPQNEIARINDVVRELDTAGFLGDGDYGRLYGNLTDAIASVRRSDPSTAIGMLEGFRDEVITLLRRDVLVREEAELFLDDAAYVIARLGGASGVDLPAGELAARRGLSLGHPIPAPGGMLLRYGAPAGSEPRIMISDLRGETVRSITPQAADGRERSLLWDLRDGAGATLPSGRYLITLRAGDLSVTRMAAVTR